MVKEIKYTHVTDVHMTHKIGIIGYKNHAERLLNILDKKRDCCVEFIYHPTKKLKMLEELIKYQIYYHVMQY